MTLRRGFFLTPGETAVVVEDVVTTGGSTREVMELLQAAGVQVVGVGSVIDRSGGRVDSGGSPSGPGDPRRGRLDAGGMPAVQAGSAGGEARLARHAS